MANSAAIDDILAGLTAIPSDGVPFIAIDAHQRFYINAPFRRFSGLQAFDRVTLYADASGDIIALSKRAEPGVAQHMIDGRHYVSARNLLRRMPALPTPARYLFEKATPDGEVFVFRRDRSED